MFPRENNIRRKTTNKIANEGQINIQCMNINSLREAIVYSASDMCQLAHIVIVSEDFEDGTTKSILNALGIRKDRIWYEENQLI